MTVQYGWIIISHLVNTQNIQTSVARITVPEVKTVNVPTPCYSKFPTVGSVPRNFRFIGRMVQFLLQHSRRCGQQGIVSVHPVAVGAV